MDTMPKLDVSNSTTQSLKSVVRNLKDSTNEVSVYVVKEFTKEIKLRESNDVDTSSVTENFSHLTKSFY